jgi:hypothetical protein
MKKLIVIGACVVLLILAFLMVRQHHQPPSDSEISQKVPGSWIGKNKKFVMTITPDGSYAYGTSPTHNSVGGTWQIRDGFFIMTITNSTAHGGQALVGVVSRCRVIHFDDHQFAYDMGGETFTFKR